MKILNIIIKYILVALMIIIVGLTFYQIVMRFIFNSPPSWTEETIRFLFVYVSLIAAGIGIMEHAHIGVDIIVNLLPNKLKKISQIIVNIFILGFGIFIIKASIPLLAMTRRQLSPTLRIPMCYIYASITIFGIMCLIYALFEIYHTVKSKNCINEEQLS